MKLNRHHAPIFLAVCVFSAGVLTGCGDDDDSLRTTAATATVTTLPSNTPQNTATATLVFTVTATQTVTASHTLVPNTATRTVSATPLNTATPSASVTATPSATAVDSATATSTPSDTETATETETPTATPTDSPVPGPAIVSVVGTGVSGFNGDGLAPLDSSLYLPQDITLGPDGLLYVIDWNNHRIRRVRNDVLETIAGSGDIGSAVDGPALYAAFNHPTQVFFEPAGTMLIAAWHNSQIKRLDLTTGLITTVAGTGARAFGGDGGPAPAAKMDLPSSVVVDGAGNLIISDQANNRLRVVDPSGTMHTMCGDGNPGYSGDDGPATAAEIYSPKGQAAAPAGRITIDSHGNIFIADTGNNVIRKIDTGGVISTVAGNHQAGFSGDNGPAVNASLNTPSDVAVTTDGTLYIADTMNSAVRRVSPDGTITTLAGTPPNGGFSGDGGPASEAMLDRPYGVDVAPNGDVYVADTHNQRIRLITASELPPQPTPHVPPTPAIIPCNNEVGTICTYAGTGGPGFNGDGLDRLHSDLYWVWDMEFTPSGRRIVLDWNNHRVREILPNDTFTTLVGSDFVGDGPADLSDLLPEGAPPLSVQLNHPTDVQEFPNGDLMVMCWHNHKIRVADHTTGRVRVIAGSAPGFVDNVAAKSALINQPPHGVLDANGNLFFIDQRNERIRVIYDFANQRENGIVKTVVGTGQVVGAGGTYNGDGLTLATALNFPAGSNPEPSGGLALAADGDLYFSDTLNNRIRRVQFSSPDFSSGVVTTIAGTGTAGFSGDAGPAPLAQINYPEDIEIGPDGNIYFADTNNNRIRSIDLSTGMIQTVVGSGENGYDGDGGPATQAKLNRPMGVAFDANGDLYVSDTFNSRIRKVKLSATP